MDKRYSIITGYWSGTGWRGEDKDQKQRFFETWWKNTKRFTSPVDVFVINSNSAQVPINKHGKWIDLSFNLGHVHDLDASNYRNKRFGGWSMTFIMGAMFCYANNCDFIFKEQDCLAFGSWVDRMYEDLHRTGASMLVGRNRDANGQGVEQSLMIIKHEFILPFVTAYLSFPADDAGGNFTRPEQKFRLLWQQMFGPQIAELSFGYGRARPPAYDQFPFYLQQLLPPELEDLKAKHLI